MGRHWLDVARYAESTGQATNFAYPHAWRYRDWVIDAFNADKPYDAFIREQLAGDLLPADDVDQRVANMVATGFLAIGPKSLSERNRRQFQADVIDEQIDATFQAFQALTVACARCHDHRFDPIPQTDYYALAGIFRNTETCYGTIRVVQSNHPSALLHIPSIANVVDGVGPLTPARRVRIGFGYLAFAGLSTLAGDTEETGGTPHPPARAKHVIFLCMEGAPSHVDTFDYKPKLAEDDGRTLPNARAARLLASPWSFRQHGESGQWISELLPELAGQADELCVLHGMHTDVPSHPQAFLQMHTGVFQFKRPSMGAWTVYGLGSENDNLPGFITISPPRQNGGPSNCGGAFLPASVQGTPIRICFAGFGGGGGFGRRRGADGGSVSNIRNPRQTTDSQRSQLDFAQWLNREALERDQHNSGVEAAIESFELAFRMQAEMPQVMDISDESDTTQALYGVGEDDTDDFGRKCLLARRFVEAGVRFVEITSGQWDHHRNLREALAGKTHSIDKPVAGLLRDLKDRGLLQDTLVLWGGEFGRTPYAQGDDGRDHNHRGFTTWMAGGGSRGGLAYGATDDYGYEAVEGKVHIHDWHATILHLLGINHEQLTYRYAGRDMRLTDVKGNVIHDIVL